MVDLDELCKHAPGAVRRAKPTVVARTGRFRRAVPLAPSQPPSDLALAATLRQAALRRARAGLSLPVTGLVSREDLRQKQRVRPCHPLIVLAVDASDSMGQGVEARMRAAKGGVLAILRRAYEDRSRVALIAFGGDQARVILPPTRSIPLAQRCLRRLPTGGATPFADGLLKAWRLICQERLRSPGVRPLLVLISDGEANVPLADGRPAWPELLELASLVRQDQIPAVLINVATAPEAAVSLRVLAERLAASYLKIADLKSRHLLGAVRDWGGASAGLVH